MVWWNGRVLFQSSIPTGLDAIHDMNSAPSHLHVLCRQPPLGPRPLRQDGLVVRGALLEPMVGHDLLLTGAYRCQVSGLCLGELDILFHVLSHRQVMLSLRTNDGEMSETCTSTMMIHECDVKNHIESHDC